MIYERNRPKGVPLDNIKIDATTKRIHPVQVKDGFLQLKASSKLTNEVMMRKQAQSIGEADKRDVTSYDFESGRMKKQTVLSS